MKLTDRVLRTPIGQKILLLCITIMGALSLYRAYSYLTTGFFLPDEAEYANDAINGAVYGFRWFFGLFNIAVFKGFGINTPDKFAIFLPIYIFIWGSLTFIFLYKLLKTLEFDEKTIGLTLFSSLFLIVFMLLSLGFLTEPMGLFFAVLGTYFLVRFAKTSYSSSNGGSSHLSLSFFVLPFLSSLSFVVASGIREPYYSLSMGGILAIIVAAWSKRKNLSRFPSWKKWVVVIFAVCLFAGPVVVSLHYPNNLLSPQVISSVIGTTSPSFPPAATTTIVIGHNSSTQTITSSNSSVSTTTSHTGTSTSSTTTTIVIGHTSTHMLTSSSSSVSTTTSHTGTSTSSTPSTTSSQPVPQSRLTDTALIFLTGIILGWGPILSIIGLLGGAILFLNFFRARSEIYLVLIILSLFALGTDVLVSYFLSGIPRYDTFGNFSSILRFSHTTLLAYFLLAPFALSLIIKRKRGALIFAAILVVFLVIAVPTYEIYASSNVTLVPANASYTGANPFALGYRSPSIQLRNYFTSNQSNPPFYIMGVPYGWNFTPGTEYLHNTLLYDYMSYNNFSIYHWSVFYLYLPRNTLNSTIQEYPYIGQFVASGTNQSSLASSFDFTVTNKQALIQSSSFLFEKVEISWK
ncbi:MAG: hypothetical protein ACYC7D_13790 [Nitrososphaerales archaeon]